MVLADLARSFVQEVFPGMGDASVNTLDAGFRLLPVVAEFDFAAHGSLIASKALLVFLEAVERFEVAAITQGGETGDTPIDTDCRAVWQRLIDFALRLDRDKPLAA